MAVITRRKTSKGEIRYQARIRIKGRKPVFATFARKTDADRWVSKTEDTIREGKYFKTQEAQKHTLADLTDRYRKEIEADTTKVKASRLVHLNWWEAELGYLTLADLTPALIAESRDKLGTEEIREGATRSPATVNRYLATISHALSTASREWGWLEDNPMRLVRRKVEPQGRVRFLSDDERERLLAACRNSSEDALLPLVVLALSSGMRRGEILGLTWKDIDLARGWITLHNTKNAERRGVPLVGYALDTVKELSKVRRIDTVLVFPNSDGTGPVSIRDAWDAAVGVAGLDDFRFHDLRHTAASYMVMQGVSIAEVAKILGHRTLDMAMRYSHLAEEHKRQTATVLNDRLFGGGA